MFWLMPASNLRSRWVWSYFFQQIEIEKNGRHFGDGFLKAALLYFDKNFIDICFQVCNC